MSDTIYLVRSDGVLIKATSTGFATEDELQKLLAGNLDLLPGALINPDSPRRWLLIEREAGVPNREGGGDWWSLDHLVVDQDAVPTFVEVKRASDTRARREVVAQMLDYAANGSAFWTPEQLRARFEGTDPRGALERLVSWLDPSDDDPESVADAFWQAVGTNLREGRIRLVFVADEIPVSLRRLVEFLNEQMPRVEVLALEIQQYRAAEGQSGALVPRLVGQTARAQAAKEPSAATARRPVPWTEEEVLEQVAQAGDDVAAVAQAVLKWAKDHPSLRTSGGRGISDRSTTIHVQLGRGKLPGVLSLYAALNGGNPALEIRLQQMCSTPPYDGEGERTRLAASLRALGIPRLQAEGVLTEIRPSVPLVELTDGRLSGLLAVVDQWIKDVRAHDHESRKDARP